MDQGRSGSPGFEKMFGRTDNIQNKNQKPVQQDENVRKEAELEEDQKSVQPMGNEAANADLLIDILNEEDNRLNISDENIENFRERPDTGKKGNRKPEKLLINYLRSGNDPDNSHNINNINNDNFIRDNEIRNDDSSSEDEEDLLNINTDPPKDKKKGKKKPDKEGAKAALEIAEEIVKDDPGQQPDKFPSLSTYAEDEDLMAVTGPKKNVRKKGTRSAADEIKPSKAGVDNLEGMEANDIRDEMVHTKITVQAGRKKEIFSPTHYESYIQIYKDPKTAIERYARYKDLKKKETEKSPMTKADKKELSTLSRLESLALQFDNAHKGYVSLSSAILSIVHNNSCEFTKLVSKMFETCDLADAGMELQGWQ